MKRLTLPIAVVALLGIAYLKPASALAASYRIASPGDSVSVSCESRSNCQYTGVVLFNNDSGQDLYDTTLYTSSSQYSGIEFVGFDGNWTSDQSQASYTIAPDSGPSVLMKMVFPSSLPADITQWIGTLYIDGKTCNLNTSPPNCYFYGGKGFQVTMTINQPSATATPTQTVPVPTNTPVPVNQPPATATPTQTSQSQAPTSTPTISPAKPTPTTVAKSNTVSGNTPTVTPTKKSETNNDSPTSNENSEAVSESQEVKTESKIAKIVSKIIGKNNLPQEDQTKDETLEASDSSKLNPNLKKENIIQKSIGLIQDIIEKLFSSSPKRILV
ncbi:MAG: hypothetical protein ABID04_02750 [Patescibacteria group bacterium]